MYDYAFARMKHDSTLVVVLASLAPQKLVDKLHARGAAALADGKRRLCKTVKKKGGIMRHADQQKD